MTRRLLFHTCLVLLLYGCPFTYDPPRGQFCARNESTEPVYFSFYFGRLDSLPPVPSLYVLGFADVNGFDCFTVFGTPKKPSLSTKVEAITLFIIPEHVILENTLEEIHQDQMFSKKVSLNQEQLDAMDWVYVYSP